jgi:hypothetical protein
MASSRTTRTTIRTGCVRYSTKCWRIWHHVPAQRRMRCTRFRSTISKITFKRSSLDNKLFTLIKCVHESLDRKFATELHLELEVAPKQSDLYTAFGCEAITEITGQEFGDLTKEHSHQQAPWVVVFHRIYFTSALVTRLHFANSICMRFSCLEAVLLSDCGSYKGTFRSSKSFFIRDITFPVNSDTLTMNLKITFAHRLRDGCGEHLNLSVPI